ncbi:MAG: hypothetical protein COV48_06160 [Elusimicrobia bacterium CG11_big_fil_rev_8_21_14_0_20_64_6]|nr:MAG: hypothetical protein COV48_06160 [Elusimicrobia bacterium CG11_big_fil_rev_8_21_14_0_20_64_6]
MSLRSFHRFFIVLCLILFAFTGYWASGGNSTALRTPWLLYASLVGAAVTTAYFIWHIRKVRLPA